MRRSSLLVTLALTGGLLALPSVASAAPADVTGLTGTVGDHAAILTWTGGGTAGAVVRDVTGVTDPLTPASGTAVASTGTAARDPHYLNTEPRTYAVWGLDSDSSTSPDPATVTVAPVAAVPTTVAISTFRTVVGYGSRYVVTGSLHRAGLGSPGQRLDLVSRTLGATTGTVVAHLTTNPNGDVTTYLVSRRSVDLVLRYAGDAFSSAADSAHRVVRMQPSLTAVFSPAVIVRPETTVLSGHVTPGLSGVLRVQRATASGSWLTIRYVTPDRYGNWRYPYNPPTTGRTSYRVVLWATQSYLGAMAGPRVLEVDTRDLRLGERGGDVLTLERTLAALHYSPGAVDGLFDRNTLHAVIAFQKVELLARSGVWGRAERARVAHPHAWRLRYPSSGHAVEVDVTRQVAVYSEGGVVKLIVDTSTGGEYRYTSDGVTSVAHTPRGSFVVQRKVNGVQISRLGYLYRPSYFTGGYAVHGEGYDVPAYPASHGCVRITDYNTDLLYAKLVVGTPVHVFDE